MAFLPIAHTIAGASPGLPRTVTTPAIDTSLSDFMLAFISFYDLSTRATPTDSKIGNTWNPLTETRLASNNVGRLFWCVPVSVGTGHIFTYTSVDDSFPSIAITTFSGAKQVTPFDVENGASGTGLLTLATGSVTPSESLELIVTGISQSNAVATASIDSGFNITDQIAFSGGVFFGSAMAYKIKTDALAENPKWTVNTNTDLAARIATFRPATSSGIVGGGQGGPNIMAGFSTAMSPIGPVIGFGMHEQQNSNRNRRIFNIGRRIASANVRSISDRI